MKHIISALALAVTAFASNASAAANPPWIYSNETWGLYIDGYHGSGGNEANCWQRADERSESCAPAKRPPNFGARLMRGNQHKLIVFPWYGTTQAALDTCRTLARIENEDVGPGHWCKPYKMK